MSIMITVRGDLTMKEIRQTIFESLAEIEDEYAIHYSRNVTLFINPTDELGEAVVARNSLGAVVTRMTKKGPYRSAADEFKL